MARFLPECAGRRRHDADARQQRRHHQRKHVERHVRRHEQHRAHADLSSCAGRHRPHDGRCFLQRPTPNTGFATYDSLSYEGETGWAETGGTSAGTPQWAALVAIADLGRTLKGSSNLDGATGTLPAIYNVYASSTQYAADFNDITTGSDANRMVAVTAAAVMAEAAGTVVAAAGVMATAAMGGADIHTMSPVM